MRKWERGLWMLVGAAALHVVEEYLLDWRSWAQELSGIALTWDTFWLANAGFLLLACAAAWLGARRPALSLVLPSLTLINGLFFHIGPTLFVGRLSPGVITATLLYLPISIWVFREAHRNGVLTVGVAAMSFALGAAVMALPFLMFATG